MKVERWNETLREPTEEKMRRYLESNGYSVVRYDCPPGTCFPNHMHVFDKKDAVWFGRFRIGAEGHAFVLGPGDMLEIHAGVAHNAEVVGSGTS